MTEKLYFDPEFLTPPLVSIIVTNYNYEKYISRCLESIVNQNYGNFECIIVDDLSSDRSVEIIEEFIAKQSTSEKFRLIRHEINQGQMAAFMTGLANTSGHFVVFVDADDCLFSDFLEHHLKAHLNTCFSAALTCSDEITVGPSGELLEGSMQNMSKLREANQSKLDSHGKIPFIEYELNGTWTFGEQMALQQPTLPVCYVPPGSGYS